MHAASDLEPLIMTANYLFSFIFTIHHSCSVMFLAIVCKSFDILSFSSFISPFLLLSSGNNAGPGIDRNMSLAAFSVYEHQQVRNQTAVIWQVDHIHCMPQHDIFLKTICNAVLPGSQEGQPRRL